MLTKLETITIHKLLKNHIEARTDLPCYDTVPQTAQSPFYFAELIGKRPDNTKTMWREIYTFNIHCIAAPDAGSVGIYDLIDKLETAMTDDLELPEPYWLVLQTNNGIQTIKKDETDEKHAVLSYDLTVCYGYKMK